MMKCHVIICLLFFFMISEISSSDNACQALIDRASVILIPKDYNKVNYPPNQKPVVVKIGFIVSDVLDVNDDAYTIKVNIVYDYFFSKNFNFI